MIKIIYACTYCCVYLYILWLNFCIGRKNTSYIEFLAVKIITTINMILSVLCFLHIVNSTFAIFSVIIPYGIPLLDNIKEAKDTTSTFQLNRTIYIALFTTLLLLFMYVYGGIINMNFFNP